MIYPDFITEEERRILVDWIEGLYVSRLALCGRSTIKELHLGIKLIDPPSSEVPTKAYIDCIFGANPMGNVQGEDVLGEVPPEVYKIKERIMVKFNLRPYDAAKTFMNYFLPGSGLGSHRHYPPKGMADLRTNLMLQMPNGAEPVVAKRSYPVKEKGLWVFNANFEHSTGTIIDDRPRIVMGFGWNVPGFSKVHWNGEVLPNPTEYWKYANIRKVKDKWVSDYFDKKVRRSVSSAPNVTSNIKQFYEKTPFPNYEPGFTLCDLELESKLFARSLRSRATGPILEVGCGTGQLSNYLGIKHQVVGVDMCENSLKIAEEFRSKNQLDKVKFIRSSLFEIPLNVKFPLVICNGVLHCTFSAYEGFKAISKFVEPGGHIIIGLYNTYGRIPFFIKKWLVLKKLWPWKIPTLTVKERAWFMDQYMIPHETTHTIGEVGKWFENNGFSVVRSVPPFDTDLFSPSKPTPFLTQLEMFFRGESFFFMIGKKL